MLIRLRNTWNYYPRQFWILFIGTLVNATGIYLIFPFISLYLTQQMNFSMTGVGVLIAAFWGVSIVAQVVSGGLVDKIGRKPVMLYSLFSGSLATLILGLSAPLMGSPGLVRVVVVPVLILLVGLAAGLFYPAANAMTADLVGTQRRTQAYALMRVVYNLGIALGPAIGGFIATRSYLTLFIVAAAAFLICAVFFITSLHETSQHIHEDEESPLEEILPPFKGRIGRLLSDRVFLLFNILYAVSMLAYAQMNTTLPVYLQGYGVSEAWYGLMMSLNAAMVVILQYPLAHRISRYPIAAAMAAGMAFFAVGFGLFGFVETVPLFFLAQAIWTVGEMITTPVSQTFVAEMAPASMRGRYMGFYGLSWGLAYGLGPLFGGLIIDHLTGHYIWYAALVLNGLVALAYLAYSRRIRAALEQAKARSSRCSGA